MQPCGADPTYLATLIDAKALEAIIDRVFPFTEVKKAISYAKGKVALANDSLRMAETLDRAVSRSK